MESHLKINNIEIGYGHPTFCIAEAGINANGSVDIAKQLIDIAINAGASVIKFQKRTIELNYTPEELAQPRESPFGNTNGDLKRALEFGEKEYVEIDRYCREKGILWTASAWDILSVDFLEQFDIPFHKIPSARNNDIELIKYIAKTGKPVIMSCGMSNIVEINNAVSLLNEETLTLMVCTANYPANLKDLHLYRIQTLQKPPGNNIRKH